jgi:hypothetical protein
MVKRKTIKKIYIDKAEYLVNSVTGSSALIIINYSQAKFDIVGEVEKQFFLDLEVFAKDLIERKSKINFA